MVMKDRLHEILNRFKDQVDYLEIRLEDSKHLIINVKRSKVESLTTDFIYGGNVRALYNGGWGFVVFKDLDELETAAEKTIQQAKLVGKDTSYWAQVEPVEYVGHLESKSDPREVSLEKKVKLLKDYTKIVDEYDEKVVSSEANYSEKFMLVTFANSEGSYIQQELADVYLKVIGTAVDGQESERAALTVGGAHDFNIFLNLEEQIRLQDRKRPIGRSREKYRHRCESVSNSEGSCSSH